MKDSLDTIIYVGKSKNSRSRVGSYFVNSKSHSSKVIKLVKNIQALKFAMSLMILMENFTLNLILAKIL